MRCQWFFGFGLVALGTMAMGGCGGPGPGKPPAPVVIEGDSIPLDANAYYATCGGRVQNLEDVLRPIVSGMEAQKIPYLRRESGDPDEWRDCSGNFLRLSSYLAAECPEHRTSLAAPPGIRGYASGGNNVVGFAAAARTNRGLAEWYHQQGRFTPIFYDGVTSISQAPADLKAARHLVRPGAVLWFARAKTTSAEGLEKLFDPTPAEVWVGGEKKKWRRLNHMGTVTKVIRNAAGEPVGYEMYHGHGRNGTPADVTKRHFWTWPPEFLAGGTKAYPPFGYWSQYLVGIGTIVPVENGSR